MNDRFLTANGIRFRYLDWGGGGPDVVLVHPTGFVADIWTPLAELLRDRFRVISIDCRGHGDSDKPAVYDRQSLVEDLRAFIAAAGLEHPIGIGHSAGATTIAGVEAGSPGAFRGAVLMEPVFTYNAALPERTQENDAMAAGTLKRRAVWPSRDAILQSYRSRPPFGSWSEHYLRPYVEHGFAVRPDGTVELKCTPASEARMYLTGFYNFPAVELMPLVRCPVLLVRGETSTTFSQDDAVRTRSLLPDSRLTVIPGSHFAPFEHPDLAEPLILRFLNELVQQSNKPAATMNEAAG